MNALEARQLSFGYPGGSLLLCQVNIQIKPGECVALKGASGCGKSTLCHILAGIIPRSIPGELTGEVMLFGEAIHRLSLARMIQLVGIVFQNPDAQLFSPTVEDEIAFGPENLCLARDVIDQRIEDALAAVNMSAYRLAQTEALSQGQKQLIALSAVLALEPQVLIFDEVFSQLDTTATLLVKDVIQAEQAKGRAILMVDHNKEHLEMADHIYHLERGRLWEVQK